jgi:Xaa-Pro dipeptidase
MRLIILSHDKNFYYLLGENFDGSALICEVNKGIIPKKLIVPQMEYERAKSKVKIPISFYKNRKELRELLKKELGKKALANFDGISANEFRAIKKISLLSDYSKKLYEIRAIKVPSELKIIRTACRITSKIEREIAKSVRVGKKEEDLAAEIEKLARRRGCGLSFSPIVASGKNSSFPHHVPGKKRIKSGEAVIVDFGIVYKGYCTDITRTYLMGASNEIKRAYTKVNEARKRILEIVRDGITTSDLQKVAEKFLGQKMVHSVLHSIGIEVHEPVPKVLKENMVICIEPAIYTKKFGIRIENVILIKKKGCEVLV